MNDLIGFYLDTGPDSEGRTLSEIWAMSDDDLMDMHDVVQWLFPLTERSSFNPHAPILTEKQIYLFREDARLKSNLLRSFHRFVQVFGLEYNYGEIQQVVSRHLDASEPQLAAVHADSQIADPVGTQGRGAGVFPLSRTENRQRRFDALLASRRRSEPEFYLAGRIAREKHSRRSWQ